MNISRRLYSGTYLSGSASSKNWRTFSKVRQLAVYTWVMKTLASAGSCGFESCIAMGIILS